MDRDRLAVLLDGLWQPAVLGKRVRQIVATRRVRRGQRNGLLEVDDGVVDATELEKRIREVVNVTKDLPARRCCRGRK